MPPRIIINFLEHRISAPTAHAHAQTAIWKQRNICTHILIWKLALIKSNICPQAPPAQLQFSLRAKMHAPLTYSSPRVPTVKWHAQRWSMNPYWPTRMTWVHFICVVKQPWVMILWLHRVGRKRLTQIESDTVTHWPYGYCRADQYMHMSVCIDILHTFILG